MLFLSPSLIFFSCSCSLSPVSLPGCRGMTARVHFQHSAELLSRLVKMEANYSLQLYPDEGHMLREESSRQHCRRRLCHFYQTCLQYFPYSTEAESPEDDY